MTGGSRQTTMTIDWRLAVLALLSGGAHGSEEAVSPLVLDTGERVPLYTVVPQYPEAARRARVEGEVEVCFNVDRDGTTRRISVRRSSNRVFEKPAKRAVRDSTYEPLPDHVQLSGIKTCRTFRFYLNPVAIEKPGD